jgi:hypothetical protein
MAKCFNLDFGYSEGGETELSALNKYKISRGIFEKSFTEEKNYKILDERKTNVYEHFSERRVFNLIRGFHHRFTIEDYFFDAWFESFKGDEGNCGSLKIALNLPKKASEKIARIMKKEVNETEWKIINPLISKYIR